MPNPASQQSLPPDPNYELVRKLEVNALALAAAQIRINQLNYAALMLRQNYDAELHGILNSSSCLLREWRDFIDPQSFDNDILFQRLATLKVNTNRYLLNARGRPSPKGKRINSIAKIRHEDSLPTDPAKDSR